MHTVGRPQCRASARSSMRAQAVQRTRLTVIARQSGQKTFGGRGGGRDGSAESSSAGNIFRSLVLRTEPKTLDSSDRAANPGPGKAGKIIRVLTNSFKLGMPESRQVYQYSVDVSKVVPEQAAGQSGRKPRLLVNREQAAAALQALAAANGFSNKFVYDNAALMFSMVDGLPAESEVTANMDGHQENFKVKLSKVASLDPKTSIGEYVRGTGSPSSQAALALVNSLLEMVTKAAPAADADSVRTTTGYLSYKTPAGPQPLNVGGQFYKVLAGFSSSVKVLRGGVFMSVDHKVGAVLEDGPLLDVLLQMMGSRDVRDLEKLKQKAQANRVDIADYQVKLSHISSRPKLQGFTQESARDYKFKLKEQNNREVSVEQYYLEQYNIKLKYPNLPCVKGRNNAVYPMELCTVLKAQRRAQVKSAKQQADLIRSLGKQAVVKPDVRLTRTKEALKKALASLSGPVAASFGLQLMDANPVMVPARMIPGPTLAYKGEKTVATRSDGSWRPPATPIRVPGNWSSGAVLVMNSGSSSGLKGFLKTLNASLGRMGYQYPKDLPTQVEGSMSQGEVEDAMKAAMKKAEAAYKKKPELLLVVLPGGPGDQDLRNEVKRVGHTVLGVATQCMDPTKSGVRGTAEQRKVEQYCDNLALKINTKLGGTTAEINGRAAEWAPFLEDKHFMVIGADVSRSVAPGKSNTKITYGAVIGTCDRQAVRVGQPQMLVQLGKNDDLIYGMGDAAYGLLKGYAANNSGALPEVIVVYRDGVSESFYDQVLATEFTAIKQAAAQLKPGYSPKITFVVVSRSHNNRFYPDPADPATAHRSGNIMPGTVVDDVLIDRFAFEFFLNSHAGLLGTNRVPKYTVLVDEFGFTADSLQIFTHWLCHTYSLCHRSVSTPPVVKYADKAAEEARQVGEEEADALAAAADQQVVLQRDYTLLSPLAMSGQQSMSFV